MDRLGEADGAQGERRQVFTTLRVAEAEAGQPRREIEVTVIRPGFSNNGLRYGEPVLAESVSLWNGAPAFCDHPGPLDQGRAGGRSVRDLVGVYARPRYEPGRGVVAALRLYPHAQWLAGVVEAHLADEAAGRPTAKLGISADMVVLKERMGDGPRPRFDVVKILAVNSADVVMNPSAGGRFERILEAEDREAQGSGPAAADCRAREEPGRGQEESRMAGESVKAEAATRALETAGEPVGSSLGPQSSVPAQVVLDLCGQVLEARLAGLALPEPAKEYLRAQFKGRTFVGAELDRAIEGVRGLLGGIVAPGVITGAGALHPRTARVALTSRERLQAALDRLMGVDLPDHLRDVPRLSGIREAYIAITGDKLFTGRYQFESSVLEANEVTTSVMADALADSLTKRLVKDYQGQPRWWEPICVRVALNDLRQQSRVLLSDFASLATVAENGAYQNVAWGDTKETYTPGKRGNLVYVTLETIINDDLRAVQRIPSKLASAAAATINEVVSGLFTANGGAGPAMADTFNVFNAVNHQGNSGTTALAAAAVEAAMVVLAKMTNSAGKRIGVQGKYLLVPPELTYAAKVIAGSTLLPGSANNDINTLYGLVVPITVPNFTDANNWYLMADPGQVECIEVGFLNGREEPELLVQDNPTDGSVFTNDAITFKVRHIYGAGWLDYRGAYGSIVA